MIQNLVIQGVKAHGDNPRLLGALAGGLERLIQLHIKLDPPSLSELVEGLILAGVGPDDFLLKLQQEKQKMQDKLK